MHQPFVTTAPTYGDGREIARQMCGAVTFLVPPQCRVSDITQIYPREFTIIKSRAMTHLQGF